ncbi:MAG: putative DNA-binding domain-containing protein, partial [Burkholderiales bacterium]|nr:putative DNA-binding domain-containing protein [Burkholderiales bacterium]
MNRDASSIELEAQRQRLLLRALWQRGDADGDASLRAWLRESPQRAAQGLAAYRTNGGALAERALGAAFPTVLQLVGEDSFALLAR